MILCIIAVISILTYNIGSLFNSPKSPEQTSQTLMEAPSIFPPVPEDVNFDHSQLIQWKNGYYLKYDDFTGTQNKTLGNMAWTSTIIERVMFKVNPITSPSIFQYNVSDIRIYAFFIRDKSWFIDNATYCGNKTRDQILRHEQGHFDISELIARKAYSEATHELYNKTFSLNETSSNGQISAISIIATKIDAIVAKDEKVNQKFDQIYDNLTNHGCNSVSQYVYNDYFKKLRN